MNFIRGILIFFIIIFSFFLFFYIYSPKNKNKFDNHSKIPFDDK